MEQPLLPLFPLQVVLFPRTPLPMHIFEERYKAMMAELLPKHGEFGVVLASEKGVVNMGCTASIQKVLKTYEDGRLDILTAGRRRFEILLLNDDEPYLRGAVEYFDDDVFDDTPAPVRERVLKSFELLREIDPPPALHDPELTDPQLSFQLAQSLSDLAFRQVLLSTRSEAERMRQLAEFLPQHIARERHATHVRAVAPLNGHARVSPDIA